MNVNPVQTQNIEKPLRFQVFKDIGRFSLASLIGGIGSFCNNYFAVLLLGPTAWGTWQGTKLVLMYGANLHLGVQDAMHRELPILRGKKESARRAIITDVTFTFSFIVAIVVSIGVLLSTFVIGMNPKLRLSLQFISAMIFFLYINGFYGCLFRANNEFDIVSKITVIDGFGNLFSIALIFFFGLLGFLGGQVLRFFIVATYSWWKSSYTVRWRWDNTVFKSLTLIGFPIMLLIFANVIFTTIDRLLILKFLVAESLGLYSLGNLVFAPLLAVFTASNSVMYPRFAERYGETSDPRSLKRYLAIPMENLAVLMSILIGSIYLALPFLIRVFLPEYTAGTQAVRILIFGLYFYAITGMAGNMLLTINKQVLRLGILLGSALLNLCFSYAALKLGYGIAGVAAGTSLAYFVFFLISTTLAMQFAHISLPEIGRLLLRVIGPIFYVGMVIVVLSIIMPVVSDNLSSMINRTIAEELIFFGLSSYFIYKIFRGELVTLLLRRRHIQK